MAVEPCTPTTSNERDSKRTPDSSKMVKTSGTSTAAAAPLSEVNLPQSPQLRDYTRISTMEKLFEDGYDSDGEKGPFTNICEVEGE